MEIIVVVAICILLLVPAFSFFRSARQTTNRGQSRLATLDEARYILERIRRDLKVLCFSNHSSQVDMGKTGAGDFSFPIFPLEPGITANEEARNAVNRVFYRFDRDRKTLTRTVQMHPALVKGDIAAQSSLVLGKGVEHFSIEFKSLFGRNLYDVHVRCVQASGAGDREETHLRTLVRSDFESRLERHLFQIPNRMSFVLPPEINPK